MDLFKWALKLGPHAPSDLVLATLRLAVRCRVLDMRASPYDLAALADQGIDFGACVRACVLPAWCWGSFSDSMHGARLDD